MVQRKYWGFGEERVKVGGEMPLLLNRSKHQKKLHGAFFLLHDLMVCGNNRAVLLQHQLFEWTQNEIWSGTERGFFDKF